VQFCRVFGHIRIFPHPACALTTRGQ
jgi:hypothetical protein